jgi:hypothetical protein
MRNIRLLVLLTEAEKTALQRQADIAGLPLSTYVRAAALEKLNAGNKDCSRIVGRLGCGSTATKCTAGTLRFKPRSGLDSQ